MSLTVPTASVVTEIGAGIEKALAESPSVQRSEALSHFRRLGLPSAKNEEYKHTPVTRILEKNFAFGLPNALATGADVSAFFLPGIDAVRIVLVNGQYIAGQSSAVAADGITVRTLTPAQAEQHAGAAKHLGRIADYSTDAFAAWNTAAWTTAVVIEIAPNKVIDKPVIIHHIHDTTAGQVVSAVRCLVISGRSSEATVVEKFDTIGPGKGFSTTVSEGVIEANAGLSWYAIQNDAGNRYHVDIRQIQQADSSRVKTYTFTLAGKLVRNTLGLSLDGQGIDSHMYGLYLLGGDTLADNHTVVDHRQPHSFSNELYKGILDDQSRGVFNGKIYVRPNAQKTNAFQANRNVLLTDRAAINTKPQLEIWADDVKCSHGCTSGQLDEEAMFYLQARGISRETARAMMLYAFAGELLDAIPREDLRSYIDALISERLHKNF